MAKKLVMPEVDEKLVKGFGLIVDMLPRGNRKDGSPYTGVLQRDVATTFYAFMAKQGHPLAEAKNEDCSFDKPCGACRRDVLQVTAEAAENAGLVVKIPRAKTVEINGKMERRSWVTYYRPGEVKAAKDLDKIAEAVLARL